MLIAIRLRNSHAGFLSSWLVGNSVGTDLDMYTLEKVCTIYEIANQQGQIMHNYVTDHLMTEDVIKIHASDVMVSREVKEDSKVFEGYQRALLGFSAEKSGLVVPPGPRPMSQMRPGVN